MKPIDLEVTAKNLPWPMRLLSIAAKTALPLVILAGAVYVFQDFRASRPDVPQRPAREKVWPVATEVVSFDRFQPRLRLYGETQTGRAVALRALVAGEIVEIAPDLRVGALVQAGTPLVRIDPFNYEGQLIEARANLAEAEARLREIEASIVAEQDALKLAREQLDLGTRDFERAKELVAKGSLSERSVDDRRLVVSQREQAAQQRVNNLTMQEARADQQRAAISRLSRKVVEAERALENTTLRAPFSGYATDVAAQVGRIVGSNDAVVTLIDRGDVEVAFTLSDNQYGRIVADEDDLIGRPVTVNWYVSAQPLTFEGRIARLAPTITATSGGVKVIAVLESNGRAELIRPGAFVEVLVPDRAYDAVVRLPETAIYAGDQVFVVEDERLRSRAVEVVGFDDASLLVRGDLEAGEVVLTTRIAVAGEGLKVRDVGAESGQGLRSGPDVSGRSPRDGAQAGPRVDASGKRPAEDTATR